VPHPQAASVGPRLAYPFGAGVGGIDWYYTGGRTTFALPVSRHTSVKFYASNGVSTRTGSNFDMVGVYVQYCWGRGL